MNIYYCESTGRNSVASVHRRTGDIYIDLPQWRKLKPEHRFFVLLHEYGHHVLNSKDELAVDQWAFNEYVKKGYSLKEAVFALSKVLTGNNPEHALRVKAQLERAILQDKKEQAMINLNTHGDEFSHISGRRKAKKARKQKKKDAKVDLKIRKREARVVKREGRAEKKHATANQKNAEAEARLVLADQGIAMPTRAASIGGAITGLIGQAVGAVTGVPMPVEPSYDIPATPVYDAQNEAMLNQTAFDETGVINAQPQPQMLNTPFSNSRMAYEEPIYDEPIYEPRSIETPAPTKEQTDKKKDNMMMYVIIGAVALVAVVFIIKK
ncbi:MAG: hypothetical protein H6553_06670 [Chitinophagales bacterium]|nr:hypothetical protein [Chitinophagales bacterium]